MSPSAGFKSRVEQILGPSTQVHAVAAVKLYLSEHQSWEWTKVSGAVALGSTNEPGKFIFVVDLTNNSIPLTQEIYENFGYDAPRDFFHSFEMDDCVAGLSFADAGDAKAFYQAVRSNSSSTSSTPPLPSVPQRPPPPTTRPPPPPYGQSNASTPLPPTPQPPAPTPQPPAPAQNPAPSSPNLSKSSSAPTAGAATTAAAAAGKKRGGLFSKLKSAFASSDVPEDFVVSDPRGFRHESHIGWDPDAGFEIRNIPPEWRKLFQAAGVRKADLRDAETAKFVMNVIGETMLSGGLQQEEVAAPRQEPAAPPPPAPTGGPAPPPPPPPPAPSAPKAPPAPGIATSKSVPASRPPPPVRDARGDLMNSIKQGTELRKVDPNEAKPLPDINNMNASDSKNLVDTLAAAMASRRNAIQTYDEEEEEEEWSE